MTLCWRLERSPGAASGHDSNTVQYDVTAMVTHHALSLHAVVCITTCVHVWWRMCARPQLLANYLPLGYMLLALDVPWPYQIAGMS